MPAFPLPFYFVCIAIALGGLWTFSARHQSWGIPAAMVMLTTAVWYLGDALYNPYEEYVINIGAEHLDAAWWQVLLFVIAYLLLIIPIHQLVNARLARRSSFVMRAFETDHLGKGSIQRNLDKATAGLVVVWLGLMAVALVRVEGNVIGLFAPYLIGIKAEPWGRGRLGGGFDAFIALAGYLQIFLTASFGVIFALSRNPRMRTIAGIIFFLSAPYFLFDRTRNTMLATMIPGLVAWVFLRLKGSLLIKLAVMGLAFLMVNFWFTFVMENRTGGSIAGAFAQGSGKSLEDTRHLGLNMLEELAWVNAFIHEGSYQPNLGQRYFAELVNPIPRTLWEGKPLIGIDYALARGQAGTETDNLVTATISTGMIGQGVVNFSRFFGPLAAAFLMSLWTALLARQDLLGWKEPARLMLYGVGLILTFNMGRDITLLVIYPFLFGLILLLVWNAVRDPAGKAGLPREGKNQRSTGPQSRKRRRQVPVPLQDAAVARAASRPDFSPPDA